MHKSLLFSHTWGSHSLLDFPNCLTGFPSHFVSVALAIPLFINLYHLPRCGFFSLLHHFLPIPLLTPSTCYLPLTAHSSLIPPPPSLFSTYSTCSLLSLFSLFSPPLFLYFLFAPLSSPTLSLLSTHSSLLPPPPPYSLLHRPHHSITLISSPAFFSTLYQLRPSHHLPPPIFPLLLSNSPTTLNSHLLVLPFRSSISPLVPFHPFLSSLCDLLVYHYTSNFSQ